MSILKCIKTTDWKFEWMDFNIWELEPTLELAYKITWKSFDKVIVNWDSVRFLNSNYSALLKLIK